MIAAPNNRRLDSRVRKWFHHGDRCNIEHIEEFLHSHDIDLSDVQPWLRDPDGRPYGRSLVYADESIEVLVMNWSHDTPCLPHDHGESEGVVLVVAGTVVHTLYEQTPPAPPVAAEAFLESTGAFFPAPVGLVHCMAAANPNEATVTVHFYHPPIHGMRIFDVDNGRACVVSDDCGAWWPDEAHLVKMVQLIIPRFDAREPYGTQLAGQEHPFTRPAT